MTECPHRMSDEAALDRRVRKLVFDFFLENSAAPVVAEIAAQLSIPLSEAGGALVRLDTAHHLKLLEGTQRILMAFPFSAISTPYRVTRKNGARYFANCAWDSVAFHAMLNEPVRVDSFCNRCGTPVRFRMEGGKGALLDLPLPRIQLTLPASIWWNDITRTCANTMVFLGHEESDIMAQGPASAENLGIVTIDQIHQMSVPLYSSKLLLEYSRPPASEIQATFERLGLIGAHWKL